MPATACALVECSRDPRRVMERRVAAGLPARARIFGFGRTKNLFEPVFPSQGVRKQGWIMQPMDWALAWRAREVHWVRQDEEPWSFILMTDSRVFLILVRIFSYSISSSVFPCAWLPTFCL